MNRIKFKPKHTISLLALGIIAALTSCGSNTIATSATPKIKKPLKAVFINPHKAGTYAHFKAEPGYPQTYRVYKNHSLLADTNPSNSKVIIDISEQRAFLMNNGVVAMDYPVSTGTKKHPTPTGSFRIMEKIKDKRSNLYGKILDKNGKTIKSNADSRKDKAPKGGKFLGASMEHWMRLTGDGIGMHKGRVPRYPASHGCIRTPGSIVPIVFKKVRSGTSVIIRK